MMNKSGAAVGFTCLLLSFVGSCLAEKDSGALASAAPITAASTVHERMVEFTVQSQKAYPDPFNDVEVDFIFTKDGKSWRVPAFWRGGQHWTVRFAPPIPGEYSYHLESSDSNNPDLNGHEDHVMIAAYSGNNELFKHGMLRVSENKRYFEHSDGTPFYWLGDTWWTGLSDRLPWDGYKTLAADRKRKGFTVVQVCAGLVPGNEELAPIDPGYSNEGGAVWDQRFERINPRYFDYADRRIELLLSMGIAPAIVGAWYQALPQMGISKMKKHWRYIIARYGAYPVFWLAGGEVYDPPDTKLEEDGRRFANTPPTPGWTEVVRYIRDTDPYRHPVSVHEVSDVSLQDASLTDFDFAQPSHYGWASIGSEVAQLNMRYARTEVTKPFVVGEIGYEMIGNTHLQDFQRTAFWLAMLNGAAGHSYGAAPIFEVNNPEKPLHRLEQYTFMSWQEGMNLPGAYQIGLGAKLLQTYPWWNFAPHPEWVTPHGTTLLWPRAGVNGYDLGDLASIIQSDWTPTDDFMTKPESVYPGGEWRAMHGNFRQPYAAGIPNRVRIVYIPYFGVIIPHPPTVLGLERGVTYHAYYWEPTLGIHFDLGAVRLPEPGRLVLMDSFDAGDATIWLEQGATKSSIVSGKLVARNGVLSVVGKVSALDAVVAVDGISGAGAGLLLRYQDPDNYIAVKYSSQEKSLCIHVRSDGVDGRRLGCALASPLGDFRLTAEVRANMAAASITDGTHTYQTEIVDVVGSASADEPKATVKSGRVGVFYLDTGIAQNFDNFEVRRSPTILGDDNLDRKLYDAAGTYRGELKGPRWSEFGANKIILLDSYRPERFPSLQDWVLVLETSKRGDSVANSATHE